MIIMITGYCITIVDLAAPVNQFGVNTCAILPLTHVMVLEITDFSD